MDPFDRVFSPIVVFKDGGGEGGGEGGGQGGGSGSGGGGAGGGSGSGGEGGSGDGRKNTGNEDHQKHFNDGFNLGFGKGAEKKEKEAQEKINAIYRDLGLDPDQENLEDQLKAVKAALKKAKEGDGGGKGKDDALVEQLRGELKKVNTALEETKTSHETEIRKILIDQQVLNLAGAAGLAKGVSPQAAAVLFKQDYVLDLDKDRKVTVTQPNGAPIVDPKTGETKTLDGVFKDWIGQNSYLLAAANRGGSGGAGPGDGGGGGGSGGGQQGADGVMHLTVEEAEKLPMDQYEKLTQEGKLKIKQPE